MSSCNIQYSIYHVVDVVNPPLPWVLDGFDVSLAILLTVAQNTQQLHGFVLKSMIERFVFNLLQFCVAEVLDCSVI